MHTLAVVLERPEHLALQDVALATPGDADVVVDVAYSGISTGTERLLYRGRMPDFPGMGYPLVPGYESVGRIAKAGPHSGLAVGQAVFVGGSRGFTSVRGLFGGAAAHLVVPGEKAIPIEPELGERGVLLALAATAHHAVVVAGTIPDLIVGHGVLGRLLARVSVALGGAPTVIEQDPARRGGALGYHVCAPAEDTRRDYTMIVDVSGDAGLLDALIAKLARNGSVVLAGFYETAVAFTFPPAFMREASIRIAAEWAPADLGAVKRLIAKGLLSLDGLVTHRVDAHHAPDAYRTAFTDPTCLKMVLDWRDAP